MVYQPDTTTLFPNPERGWVMSYNPTGADGPAAAITVADLQALRNGFDHVTLVRKYYLLKPFLAAPIAPAFLSGLQADFNACRAAGAKLIPRFAYIWNPAPQNQDAPLALALQHVSQIAPLLAANSDVLAYMEAGFVGHYGEWNSTDNDYIDNFSDELLPDGIAFRDSLFASMPADRFLAMRYLYWHRMAFWPAPLDSTEAFNGSMRSRVALHNDFIMGFEEWAAPGCGICPPYTDMLAHVHAESKWIPHFGEPCANDPDYYTVNDPRVELRAIHQSTLMRNSCIDFTVWQDSGWYNGLTRDLGYRIQLDSLITSAFAVPGGTLTLRLHLLNSGYAAPYNARGLELVLRESGGGLVHVIDLYGLSPNLTDPRYWLPGPVVLDLAVPLPVGLPLGTYDLLLHLPDPYPLLHDDPDYAIRLANVDLWEPTTGYNNLQHSLTVELSTSVGGTMDGMAIQVAPQPFAEEVRISGLPLGSRVHVFDTMGREVYAGELRHMNVANWAPGIHLLRSGPICVRLLKQ